LIADNAVLNGDFEEGPWVFKNESLGVLLPTNLDEDSSPLPGWIVESNRAVRYVDSNHFDVPQEKRAIELLSGKEGIISQMVDTTPKKDYTLSFSMGQGGDKCKEPLAVMAFAGDQAQNFHYICLTRTLPSNELPSTSRPKLRGHTLLSIVCVTIQEAII